VEDLQQGLFNYHDDLVYSSFVGFSHYELWNAVNRTWMLGTMSGNMMLEDAHYRFRQTGNADVFLEAERHGHPGSPLPISEGFNRMGTLTRELCQSVENGTITPSAAAAEILDFVQQVDFFPHADKFGLPENRCFHHMTQERMEAVEAWSRTSAPPNIGPRTINAIKNMALTDAEEVS
jgi:FADH2 O2-dependent halogenase